MARNDEITLNNFINMLYESTENGQRFCFVLGAGASVESGIPSGLELSRRWLQELKRDYSKEELDERMKRLEINGLDLDGEIRSEDYFDIYDLRFSPDYKNGYAALEKVMENIEPSYGYYPLAMHLANTNNNLVITTNFDSLVEDALFICTQKKPFVVVHESLAKLLTLGIQRPIIAKIHRGLFFEPMSRREQLRQMDKAWIKALGDEFKIYTPIVIGYGGGDNTLMALLKDEDSSIKNIYWCYRGEKPKGEIKEIIDQHQGYFIEIGGFDEFMYLLNEKFGYERPTDFMDKIHGKRKEAFQTRERELYERLKGNSQSTSTQNDIVQTMEAEWDKRIKELTLAINADPDDAEAYHKRGIIESILGRSSEAIADYDKAIELDPKNAAAYCNRGVAKGKMGDLEGVIADYDEAIKLDPKNAEAYYTRGIAKDGMGDSKGAIADYDKAIELDPEQTEAYYKRGVVKGAMGDFMGAKADCDEAIKLAPKDAWAYCIRGLVKAKLGIEGAIADCDEAIKLAPKEVQPYWIRGLVKDAMEDFKGAIADYDEVIKLDTENAAAYNNRGYVKNKLGQYEEAIIDCNKAINLDANDANPYRNRGDSQRMLGKYNKAIADYTRAIELNPEYIEAYEGRATAYEALGQTENANRDRETAEALRNKK